MVRLSFVCTGNICRSPAAEVVMRHLVRQEGLEDEVHVESAGLGGWHAGEDMDPRTARSLRDRGYPVPRHAAREVQVADFDRLDLLVALDLEHLTALRHLAPDDAARDRVVLLGEHGEGWRDDPGVPDPYYGGADGFAEVLDRVEDACRGLLERVRP